MFGCIGKVVVLVLFVVAGAAAYVTRDRWEPRVRERLGLPRATKTTTAPTWEPVTVEGAERARAAIATLKKPTGPAFLNVKAADLVAFALDSMLRRIGQGAKDRIGTEALAGDNLISIRGKINVKELGGASSLGPLGGMLEGDQPVEIRGRLEVTGAGKAQLRVERVTVNSLVLPSPVVNMLVERINPKNAKAGAGLIPFALPPEIADIRVSPGRVTLYKAVK
jgi:hypothetical protein